MAADTQETSTSDQQQAETWLPPQYEAALAHIERLQKQLDNLRSILPSIVAPLVQPGTSKAQTFAKVRKSALQSTQDLRSFREQWTSEQTQQLFARSSQSVEKDGDLTKAGEVAKSGWS